MLNNLITGSRLNVKGNIIDLNFHIDNIFNAELPDHCLLSFTGKIVLFKLNYSDT